MQKKESPQGLSFFAPRICAAAPCRAGPVCPAGTNAVFCGGTHGSRPTRCGGHTGRTESSAPTRFVRDVGDAVPYTLCHCEPVRAAKQVPLGYRPARQSVFPALAPLDKPVGMGIIVDVRGRCDKRSAPCKIGNLRIRNRHLAEWRFRLFSF